MERFREEYLSRLYRPAFASSKTDNGQITIIGGSGLFHGAPLLALKVASRLVDMVYFSSPAESIGPVAAKFKSRLLSFIWVPWEEAGEYVKKSEAVLIGPGFLRFRSEKQREQCELHNNCGEEAHKTKKITEGFLQKFPDRQWVIDAGSLQTMNPKFIPKNSILTPNKKELGLILRQGEILRKDTSDGGLAKPDSSLPRRQAGEVEESVRQLARKHNCIIVLKGPKTLVISEKESVIVTGGNAGLTKGGTGDVLAGLTVALAAKNKPFLAAAAANFIAKKAADELYQKVGFAYNSDDLADKIPEVLGKYFR